MIYIDSNVLIYATLSKVDTQSQQDKAIEILKELIVFIAILHFSNTNHTNKKNNTWFLNGKTKPT